MAIPDFVDIDKITYTIDVDKLETPSVPAGPVGPSHPTVEIKVATIVAINRFFIINPNKC